MFLNQEKWYRECLDTVTHTTVNGYRQAESYCSFTQIDFKLAITENKYKFGDDKQTSLNLLKIRISILEKMVL